MQVLPVNWSVDTLDWTTKNADEIVNKVVTEVKENDIILMHDCYESSVNAALRIVDILKESGYEFVTVVHEPGKSLGKTPHLHPLNSIIQS